MLELLLLAQVSLFGSHLQLGEEPPELRAARHIVFLHEKVENAAPALTRTREEALELARSAHQRLCAGEDFAALARSLSEAPTRSSGGVLGSFPAGVLAGQLDGFLFQAEIGAFSGPIDSPNGVQLFQRIEAQVGVLQILVQGEDDAARERAQALCGRLAAGADFAALAREHSDDPLSRAHGGQYAVFERGGSDALLKQVAFDAELGATIGPLRTPLGWHVLRRVPPSQIAPELWERRFVRLRAVVLAHEESQGLDPFDGRTRDAALALAENLRRRIEGGEEMAEIARALDDDPCGRERAGDLGWWHRSTPGLPHWLARAWLEPVGWLSDVISTPAGFILLRRER